MDRRKRSSAAVLVALCLAVFLWPRDPERSILKMWSAHYEDATETLTFYPDGHYSQHISFARGGRFDARGSWHSVHSGERWDLVLDRALDPFDSDECTLLRSPRETQRELRVVSRWFGRELLPCPNDDRYGLTTAWLPQ